LHFDRASKNNPGEAGAGGIIKDSHGKTLVRYEWGLGQMSNNLAEAYSLYLGTLILNWLRIRNPIIVGDSAIVIAAMVAGKKFKKEALNNVKLRIEDNVKEMGDTTFKHVLRDNNTEADHYATKATNRQIGKVKENDLIYENPRSVAGLVAFQNLRPVIPAPFRPLVLSFPTLILVISGQNQSHRTLLFRH
jgi:ribonuclease HI